MTNITMKSIVKRTQELDVLKERKIVLQQILNIIKGQLEITKPNDAVNLLIIEQLKSELSKVEIEMLKLDGDIFLLEDALATLAENLIEDSKEE